MKSTPTDTIIKIIFKETPMGHLYITVLQMLF